MNKPMEDYRESLAKLIKRFAASRFLRWWLGELAGMVPERLRQDKLGLDDFTLVDFDRTEVGLGRLEDGRVREVCRIPLNAADADAQRMAFLAGLDKVRAGRREVALTLPSGRLLRKTLTLPLATEENLHQVLAFQMEQHTPFTPDQIYFGYSVKERDFERGRLTVEFVATPRDAVDEAVKALVGWGALVRAVVAEDMLANGSPVNMLPAAQGKTPSALLHGANPWLAGLVLLLVLAALSMPLVIKREAILQLNPWVEKGKNAAEATDILRRELEGRIEQHNYLLDKKRTFPPAITVLEELTRVLPDDTWVQQLDIKAKELQIQGETASSSRLISLFEQSGMFHGASFRSPLTKGMGAGAERYHLTLEIHPMPEKPAQAAAAAAAGSSKPAEAEAAKPATPATEASATPVSKPPAPAVEKKP